MYKRQYQNGDYPKGVLAGWGKVRTCDIKEATGWKIMLRFEDRIYRGNRQ